MNMFGGGNSGATPERYVGMMVSGSQMGQPVPYLAGRNRIGINLCWYGDFVSTPVKTGKGGGGSSGSWNYSAAWQALVCLGPIQAVPTVWLDKSIVTLSSQNLTLALGATGQAIWGGYPSGTPSAQEIPYSNECWIGASSYQFGSSPAMPNFNLEVEGRVPGYSDAHGVYDADISAVFQDYLLDPVIGALAGPLSSLVSLGSPDHPFTGTSNSFQAACNAQGLLISPIEENQRACTDFMREVLQIANADVCVSCGVLKFIPYADQAVSATLPDGTTWSYTPNLTPLFELTYDDFCPKRGEQAITLKRKARDSLYNLVNVEYVDRSNQYNPTTATAANNKDIAERGQRPMPALSLHQICTASTARTVAQLVLQHNLNDINTYVFRLRGDYAAILEPGDILAVNEPALNVTGVIGWITDLEEDEEGYLQVEILQILGTTRNTPQYNWQGSQGYVANFDEAPPSVVAPAIFQMPAVPQSLSEGITIGIAVCGPSSSTSWGGCTVWMSSDGGTTYQKMAKVGLFGPANYGTLTAALPATADPDTTSTLSVALANTNQQLPTTVTHADADNAETLALLGFSTNVEVIAYGSATLTSAGNYNLTYLRRGLYGTTPQAQGIGANFINLDGTIFEIPVDPGMAGRTLYFKFTSFNPMGRAEQDISAVTAYSYTVPAANPVSGIATLVPRGSCAISGATIYKATIGSGAWDSDVYSTNPYSSISISGQYSAAGTSIAGGTFIGLVTGIATVNAPTTTTGMYGFLVSPVAALDTIEIFDGGTGVIFSSGAAPNKNDLFQVTYDGFTVRYYYNGLLLASSQHQGLSLYAYVDMYSPGAVMSNVETTIGALATPSQFVATGTCVVNDTNALKQGGANNTWDACIYSVIGYQTCHITAKENSVAQIGMIGLSTNPTASSSYTNANYALYNSNGTWQIYESGTLVSTLASVALTDVAAITYDGSTLTYYLNGVSQRTVSVSGLTLYGFCPFYTTGAGINSLRFGPTTNLAVADTPQIGGNAATSIYTSTVAGPTNVNTAGGNSSSPAVLLTSLSPVALPFATTHVVTITGFMDMHAVAQQNDGYVAVSTTASLNVGAVASAGGFAARNLDTSHPDAGGAFAIEQTYSVPANTSQTYYVYGAGILSTSGGSAGSYINVSNLNTKVEVIKR